MSGFRITQGKGFHITFENGWTVSVQFGPGNYSDNYGMLISRDGDVESGKRGSSCAEVAAWDDKGNWHKFGDDEYADTVSGHQTASDVLAFMNRIAALQKVEA